MQQPKEINTGFGLLCYRCVARAFIALLFCAVLSTALLSDASSIWLQNAICIVFLCVFIGVHYVGLWDSGSHDGTQYRFNKAPKTYFKGLLVSLVSAVPFAVVNLIIVLSYINTGKNLAWIFRLINIPVFFITRNLDIGTLSQGVGAALILPGIMVVLGGLAYFLGFKDISLLIKLIFKKNAD